MRSNSLWFKSRSKLESFIVLTGLGICTCVSSCQPVFQSYFRNKSLLSQASVTFWFLSLLTCYPKEIHPAAMGKTFFICLKTAFPIICIFKPFSKHIHESTQPFPNRCALGDTFIEPAMVVVNVLLLREFTSSKPHGIHGEFRL